VVTSDDENGTFMADRRVCARCGTALKAYAGDGSCSGLLLRGGLEAEVDRAPAEASSPATSPTSLPHTFGDYELLEVIARGGHGDRVSARQRSLNRIVAVKMLLAGEFAGPSSSSASGPRPRRSPSLQHPNIVAIHEIGQHDGHPFSRWTTSRKEPG